MFKCQQFVYVYCVCMEHTEKKSQITPCSMLLLRVPCAVRFPFSGVSPAIHPTVGAVDKYTSYILVT